jgi:peptidyl-tRNA hydrolase, PTH1 family
MAHLIVGLGNPGKEYARTRHNFGFDAVSKLIEKLEAAPTNTKLLAKTWTAKINGQTVHILEPETFMNLSGNAVGPFLKSKKIPPAGLIVVHDDLDIPFGDIRVSKNSSAGGHNGVQSIIDAVGTKEFVRIRLGVGRPPEKMPTDAYVLARFSKEESATLPAIIDQAVETVFSLIAVAPAQAEVRQ